MPSVNFRSRSHESGYLLKPHIFVGRYRLNRALNQSGLVIRAQIMRFQNVWIRVDEALILVFSYTAIFVCPWKMVSVSVRYLFYQPTKVRKTGQQKTCNVLRVLPPISKPVLQQIRLLTGLNVGGKTCNIAIQIVFQQCCKTNCTFFVARFSVP